MKKPASKITTLLFALILFTFSNCSDREVVNTPAYDIDLGTVVKRSISGFVFDPSGNPVSDAKIELRGENTTSNEEGFFAFMDQEVYEKHVYVKVHHPGYFLGSRSIIPTEGINQVVIQLLARKQVGTLTSSEGGTVKFEGVSIEMGAGFMTSDGSTYEGEVNVFAKYIDPLGKDLNSEMPGSLRGTGPDGETLLTTYGMIAVELTDDKGNEIQLSNGNSAELTMPIPEGLQYVSPTTIPLWHFDEEKGYWIEEGEAKKINNTYVGEVGHFSFWNFDIKIPAIQGSGRIINKNGDPVSYAGVTISAPGAGQTYGRTSSQGLYSGIMPINVQLTMTIRASYDKEVFTHSFVLPPNGIIEDIVLSDDYVKVETKVTVFGQVIDCDGEFVNDAYLLFNNSYRAEMIEDQFSIDLPMNVNYSVQLIHNSKSVPTSGKKWLVGDTDLDVGRVSFCIPKKKEEIPYTHVYSKDVKSFYASYTVDGINHRITEGFEFFKDRLNEKFELNLGNAAFGTTSSQTSLSIDMSSGYWDTSVPNHHYLFDNDTNSVWFIDFTTDWVKSRPIKSEAIKVSIPLAQFVTGGKGRITFSGIFTEWDEQTNQDVERKVTDGIIEYELN